MNNATQNYVSTLSAEEIAEQTNGSVLTITDDRPLTPWEIEQARRKHAAERAERYEAKRLENAKKSGNGEKEKARRLRQQIAAQTRKENDAIAVVSKRLADTIDLEVLELLKNQ